MPRLHEDPPAGERPEEFAGERGSGRVDRLRDPDAALQHARELAWRALNRRDRTVAELREILAGKRAEPATIDLIVAELAELGYLDDKRYARRFTEDRRQLDSWGNDRIERRLRLLGVDGEYIQIALDEEDAGVQMDRAVELLRRRFPSPPVEAADRSRALGYLLRRGYESEAAYEALRRHAAG